MEDVRSRQVMPFCSLCCCCLCWSEKQIADYRCGLRLLSFNPGCMPSSAGNGQHRSGPPCLVMLVRVPRLLLLSYDRNSFIRPHNHADHRQRCSLLEGSGIGNGECSMFNAWSGKKRKMLCCKWVGRNISCSLSIAKQHQSVFAFTWPLIYHRSSVCVV